MTARYRVQAISGWATLAMLSIAGFAVANLLDALSPLVDAWAARRVGDGDPSAGEVVAALRTYGPLTLAVTLGLAALSFIVWLSKARANAVALTRGRRRGRRGGRGLADRLAVGVWFIPVTNLILPPLQVADLAVSSLSRERRDRRGRRRMLWLVWLWWTTLLSALVALAGGAVAKADNARELSDLRDHLVAGERVDVGLAVDLFGREMALRLPSAALFVIAAGFALLVIARVTNAQYARVAKLRGAQPVHLRNAFLATAGDWTVELPATAAFVGGTIGE